MTAPTDAPARDVLTQAEAEARAARVSEVRYDLTLDLAPGGAGYRGEAVIAFHLAGDGDTFLDFRGKRIETLEINGRTLTPDWTGYRLTLPSDALAAQNTVRVVYENEYDTTGDGLHHFTDPEDGEEYLYTHFEPYNAHRLFPCFDQPDIKGVYRLTATAPDAWVVLSNSPEESASPAGEGRTRHVFAETARFSTYLFALVAGAYHAWREEHNGLPLGFYCRRSLVKYVDTEELFTVTRQGMDFFQEFFAYPYPFGKYDQVFVPEFNAGAMENVGLVVHYERMIFRDPPTDSQRLSRAETVLHEMAHMWFGNLVTMRWWNDLWLNESFATYMAYVALDEATRFKTAWRSFNAGMKGWAYRQDQLVTTHPIAGEVADTDETFLNFDGITYGKGAASLQQLVAFLGIDGFREGMRRYFQQHAFGNATLREFLAALEEGSGRELGEWSRLWLETPSLNTLTTTWEADGGRLTSLRLGQSASTAYPTLRPHRVQIALVREAADGVTVESVPAEISDEETDVEAARGKPAPALVFPNYQDKTFAKVALDTDSLQFVRESLERIDDVLLRQLLWQSLWNMVRDQQLKSTEYLALAREKIVTEPDRELVEVTLGYMAAALGSYVPDARRREEFHAMFEVAWRMLQQAQPGDEQITWARALVNAAVGPDDLHHVARLADGEITVPGLTLDQELRWSVAVKWTAYAIPGAEERVAEETRRDPSDRGKRAALRAETARPTVETKAAAWERFHGEGYGSLHYTTAAMSGFNWTHQRDLLQPYVEAFFTSVPRVFQTSEAHEFATGYFGNLFPGYRVERETLSRSERLVSEVGEDQPFLLRMLREANDDLTRAIAVRAFAES